MKIWFIDQRFVKKILHLIKQQSRYVKIHQLTKKKNVV